jgi:hypothetical protein
LSLRQDWKEVSAISNHINRPSAQSHHLHSLEVIMSKDEVWAWSVSPFLLLCFCFLDILICSFPPSIHQTTHIHTNKRPFFDLVIILLFLPSILTIVTLLLHRISTYRKRRADRAPRELVNRLPSVIWAKDMEKGIPVLSDSHINTIQGSQPSISVGWLSGIGDWLQKIQPRISDPIIFSNPRSEQTPLLRSSNSHQVVEPVLRKQRQKVYFSQRECALCLSDFEVGDLIRILPCGHCFHQSQLEEQCMGIDCWLLKSKRFVS